MVHAEDGQTEDRITARRAERLTWAAGPLRLGRKGFGTAVAVAQICGLDRGHLHTDTHTQGSRFPARPLPSKADGLKVVAALPWATAESFCVPHAVPSGSAIGQLVKPHHLAVTRMALPPSLCGTGESRDSRGCGVEMGGPWAALLVTRSH